MLGDLGDAFEPNCVACDVDRLIALGFGLYDESNNLSEDTFFHDGWLLCCTGQTYPSQEFHIEPLRDSIVSVARGVIRSWHCRQS